MSVFDRWRKQRRENRQWLLVRPPVEPEQPWQWCWLPTGRQGDWPPPREALLAGVALVIPASHCSHFQVPAPPGLKRHEWPQLLEDVLQQPAELVHLSCLGRVAGHLELLVVERAPVQAWLDQCEVLGVVPGPVWSELQLLPSPVSGEVVHWHRPGLDCLMQNGLHGERRWLVWPHLLGDFPNGWLPTREWQGSWPEEWAALGKLPSLLEGLRPTRNKVARTALFSPLQRRLMVACGGFALCWGALVLGQFWQQIAGWKAQVETLTGPVNSPQQATRQLARIQGEHADWQVRQQQLLALEQSIDQWLASQPEWGISGSHFDGRSWRLVLNGSTAEPGLSHWQAIAQQAGVQVGVEPATRNVGLTVSFDFGVQP